MLQGTLDSLTEICAKASIGFNWYLRQLQTQGEQGIWQQEWEWNILEQSATKSQRLQHEKIESKEMSW